MMHSVSVVIPALNEEKYIGRILTDLLEQTVSPKEIIVIDGQSSDATLKVVAKFPAVTAISYPPQVANQRNRGALSATGDLIIFLDADTHIGSTFIQDVITNMEKKDLDIAVPRYLPFNSKISYILFFHFFNTLFFIFQKIIPSGAGCGIFVRAEVFKKYGPYNSSFTYDDIELIRRIAKKAKFGIIPTTVFVSDRRFRKYGLIYMITLYLLLSLLFCLGLFKAANKIKYSFGKF